MAGINKMALVYILIATEVSPVHSRRGDCATSQDVKSLKNEIQLIKTELQNLGSKHENFESRNRESNTALIKRLEKLEKGQNKLEEQAGDSEAIKQFVKKSVDNLEKQIKDKIETMTEALNKIEKKSYEKYVVLEGSFKLLEGSMKDKLKELQLQLTENKESSQEKNSFVLESLDKLNKVVNSDLKAKVDDFDKHITSLRAAKEEVDKVLTELQTFVDKISPNTFNKENAVMAFMLVVAFVLILVFWVYKLQQNVTGLKKYQ